ncbi:MAG: isoamylase early set domain-containing protein [Candidatus Hermodarchaeota archaeon]
MAKKTSSSKKKAPAKKKTTFELEEPKASSVHLVGSFNNWDPEKTAMKQTEEGTWTIDMKLAPGTYEYRFYIDGEWRNDPKGTELRDNPFGTKNNVRIVE